MCIRDSSEADTEALVDADAERLADVLNDSDSEAETDALVLRDSLNDADSLAEIDALTDACLLYTSHFVKRWSSRTHSRNLRYSLTSQYSKTHLLKRIHFVIRW